MTPIFTLRIPPLLLAALTWFTSCTAPNTQTQTLPGVRQWEETEFILTSTQTYDNPYTDVEIFARFIHDDGDTIIRPGFWDEENTWKVRFASPHSDGRWTWESYCSDTLNAGLHRQSGQFRSIDYPGDNSLIRHGLLRMSPGKRNVVHADGTPFLLIADTPWALPWRATLAQVRVYAQNRKQRGFNAALLMSLQPDREATGPEARDTPEGFAVAFRDLPDGHLNRMNPVYFQTLDSLVAVLIEHGIVPVYQPVFHGFGWKGKNILGWNVDPAEYARYCRYLVARYGARPAMWLVAADGDGLAGGVVEGGQEIEHWDAYRQPAGIHYNPFDDWSPNNEPRVKHYNRSHQDASWLDFQWAQTGHGGEHLYHKVARMYDNTPVKAVANGEPTYEGIRDPANGAGWWQGEEAWMQLMSGGTMGVVYGAGGLWQWKVQPDEPGWPAWANSEVSWKEAIELDGSRYVGFVGKAFTEYEFTDMERRPELAGGKPCLAKEGTFYAVYLSNGGEVNLSGVTSALPYRWFNPRTGEWTEGERTTTGTFTARAPDAREWVLFAGNPRRMIP